MKVKLILMGLVIIAFIIGCSTQPSKASLPTVDPNYGWKTYNVPSRGLSSNKLYVKQIEGHTVFILDASDQETNIFVK